MKSETLKDIGKRLLACVVLVLFAFLGTAHCQLPLSPSPMPRLQFFDKSGKPLSGGKVFTYQAGTTTLQSTFVDASGSFFNTNPIILDSGGFGSIWLTSSSYKFVVQDRFGQAQWTADNVIGFAGLTSLANVWALPQTFTQPLNITPVNNQLVMGTAGNSTTLDFPAPSSGLQFLHFPNATDTMVGRASFDTLTNKILTAPQVNNPIINGVPISGYPATYAVLGNANPTGTTLNTLTKLMNAPSQVTISGAGDTGGVIGICVSGCGNTALSTIQQNGVALCVFDGAVTSGNYVSISPTVAGNCHDAGASFPLGGQVVGRSIASAGGVGTYFVDLFSPEIRGPGLGALLGQAAIASFVAGAGAGTGPTIVCNVGATCLDNGGQVKVVTGTGPPTGDIVTVNFGAAHNGNACTISPFGLSAAALNSTTQVYVAGSGGTQFVITSGSAAIAASTSYVWNYTCTFR